MKKDQLPVLHCDKRRDEEKNTNGCCSDARMARYAYYVGVLFTLLLGPWSGAQLCLAYLETDFLFSALATLLLFMASFLMTVNSERMVVRVWWIIGMIWMVVGYVIYYRKDFTEKPEAWLYVATAQSCLLLVTSLPLMATDPGLMTCM